MKCILYYMYPPLHHSHCFNHDSFPSALPFSKNLWLKDAMHRPADPGCFFLKEDQEEDMWSPLQLLQSCLLLSVPEVSPFSVKWPRKDRKKEKFQEKNRKRNRVYCMYAHCKRKQVFECLFFLFMMRRKSACTVNPFVPIILLFYFIFNSVLWILERWLDLLYCNICWFKLKKPFLLADPIRLFWGKQDLRL